jgi:hypothetical protein
MGERAKERLEERIPGLQAQAPICWQIEDQVPLSCASEPMFILSGEIAAYTRKMARQERYITLFDADFTSVEKFNMALEKVEISSLTQANLRLDSK